MNLLHTLMSGIIAGLVALSLSGCVMVTHHCCEEPIEPTATGANTGYFPPPSCVFNSTSCYPSSGRLAWPREIWVYRPTGSRRMTPSSGILLLHEITGATPACFNLASQMADATGCTIYVPILFGVPGQDNFFSGLSVELFNDDWAGTFLSEHHTPTIVDKLRALKDELSIKEKIKHWGVVGMCMTGSFSLAFASDPDVKAIVIAQPATPALYLTPEGSRSLGLSPADLQGVAQSKAHIFFIRFEKDIVSARRRLKTVHDLMGKDRLNHFQPDVISEYGPYIMCDAHNTLTYPRNLLDPKNPVNQHVKKLMELLRDWMSE